MDQHSILDRNSASPAGEGDMSGSGANRSSPASVSAGLSAAAAHQPKSSEPGLRLPGEDSGHSLAEMAHLDLDAALQLLAERAQYITGASGATIALRRGEHNDMLCRASVGSNAPELGALLSMEYGLSGESVRTRQTLRCDDAERDPRVNREGCRQLGIASVVVMPIVSDEQVLGVFELFSGKVCAFEPRDFSALQRLTEMVETAVRHAVAAQTVPEVREPAVAEPQPSEIAAEAAPVESPAKVTSLDFALTPQANDFPPNALAPPEPVERMEENTELEEVKPEPLPKKPLFWSATRQAPPSTAGGDKTAESVAVPPGLRNLQKCQACGFPVSQGRTFCVECEEKQWRGQRLPLQSEGPARTQAAVAAHADAGEVPLPNVATAAAEPMAIAAQFSMASRSDVQDPPADAPASGNSTLFLSSAASSDSWFAANKYILGALLVVAIIVGAILWLR